MGHGDGWTRSPRAAFCRRVASGKPEHPPAGDGRFLEQVAGRLNSGVRGSGVPPALLCFTLRRPPRGSRQPRRQRERRVRLRPRPLSPSPPTAGGPAGCLGGVGGVRPLGFPGAPRPSEVARVFLGPPPTSSSLSVCQARWAAAGSTAGEGSGGRWSPVGGAGLGKAEAVS